jgi:hypothetical protein
LNGVVSFVSDKSDFSDLPEDSDISSITISGNSSTLDSASVSIIILSGSTSLY